MRCLGGDFGAIWIDCSEAISATVEDETSDEAQVAQSPQARENRSESRVHQRRGGNETRVSRRDCSTDIFILKMHSWLKPLLPQSN